ncbi:hypothetical protein [Streptomyces sp. NPDC005876]|jgi:hypothetical protein
MLRDPYAVLRALLRAEASRNAPKSESSRPDPRERRHSAPARKRD